MYAKSTRISIIMSVATDRRSHFDHAAIVAACMPPRPFMMIAPTEDEDMPREGVDELIPVVCRDTQRRAVLSALRSASQRATTPSASSTLNGWAIGSAGNNDRYSLQTQGTRA